MIFNIPQFIDTEDKIVGPLTAKQLGFAAAAGALLLILWTVLDMTLFIILALPIVLFFGALAFYRPNGRSFSYFISSAVSFFFSPKIYVWRKGTEKEIIRKAPVSKQDESRRTAPKNISSEKLEEISRLLDRRSE